MKSGKLFHTTSGNQSVKKGKLIPSYKKALINLDKLTEG
jgi:hypothetical protein